MTTEPVSVERGSSNVFADIGLPEADLCAAMATALSTGRLEALVQVALSERRKGREEGLEEAAKKAEQFWINTGVVEAIRSLKDKQP